MVIDNLSEPSLVTSRNPVETEEKVSFTQNQLYTLGQYKKITSRLNVQPQGYSESSL